MKQPSDDYLPPWMDTPWGKLRRGGTRTALDGSRVTDSTDCSGKVVGQMFEHNGKTWWQAIDRLCSARDIDAARKLTGGTR